MTSRTIAANREAGGEMGKVYASIVVRNADDERRAERGEIPLATIREVRVDATLVDTGPMTLCLPANLTAALGLPVARTVDVSTAAGIRRTRLFEGARLLVEGRSGIVECLELPGGTTPLLGVIPLEQLGLEPDVRTQRLRVLPDEGAETYVTIL